MSDLNEALGRSLARVMHHTQNSTVGIITAHRGTHTAAENKSRNQDLARDIRAHGFGFAHIRGRYIENYGTKDARPVDEHSFLVIGKKGHDSGALKGFLQHHGEKYGQDSVIHKAHNESTAKLLGTREGAWPGKGKEEDVGHWHPNRFSEFHSVLRTGKFHSAMQGGGKSFAFTKEEWEGFAVYNPVSFSSRVETLF